jgi:hypothetical protein
MEEMAGRKSPTSLRLRGAGKLKSKSKRDKGIGKIKRSKRVERGNRMMTVASSGGSRDGGRKRKCCAWMGEWMHRHHDLAVLLAVIILLRIPSLFEPYWYGDEGVYLTLGQAWRKGLLLYRDIHDNKPPLIYWISGIAGSVFWLRFILIWWQVATVVVFGKLVDWLFKSRRAVGVALVGFAALTTLPLWEGQIANGEIFMIGPVIAGMYLALSAGNRPGRWRLMASGGMLALGFLFKAPAALDLAALGLFWLLMVDRWREKELMGWLRKVVWVGVGWAVPVGLTVVGYSWVGAGREYVRSALLQNVGYLSTWGGSGGGGLMTRAVVLVGLLVGLAWARKKLNWSSLLVMVWLVTALFGALLSGRPYPHYLIQVAPAAALLLGMAAGLKWGWGRKLAIVGLGGLVLIWWGFGFWGYRVGSYYGNFVSWLIGEESEKEYQEWFDPRVPRTYQVAEYIVKHTLPEDKIFIWGDEPYIYALSGRLPTGRYTVAYHVVDFNGYNEVVQAIEAEPPVYILKIKDEKRPFPELELILSEDYILADEIEDVSLYRYSEVLSRLDGGSGEGEVEGGHDR